MLRTEKVEIQAIAYECTDCGARTPRFDVRKVADPDASLVCWANDNGWHVQGGNVHLCPHCRAARQERMRAKSKELSEGYEQRGLTDIS